MDAPGTAVPPPLTRWGWIWRNLAVLVIGGVVWAGVVDAQAEHAPALFWLDLALGIAAVVLVQYRRRWPLPVALLLNAVSALSASAAGAALLAAVSLATRRRWREIIPVAVVAGVAGVVWIAVEPSADEPWPLEIAFLLVFIAIAISVGMYIGARRELVATLQDRAERAEREQALQLAQARVNERARIAREMHDVLAHRISLVAMHAGALGYRTDLTREETATAAAVIQDNAHRALADLREILGVLRTGADGDAPEQPQPTLADLDALIEDERRAGAKVRMRTAFGDPAAVPDYLGRNAYRIIQECLTNARKHAPGTSVDVVVAGKSGRSLVVLVRNPLPLRAIRSTPGATLGLVGLAERAALSGGRLEHRVRRGQFVVRAQLPWPT